MNTPIKKPQEKHSNRTGDSTDTATFGRLRRLIHRQLIENIEKDGSASFTDDARIAEQVDWLIQEVQQRRDRELSEAEKNQIRREIIDEVRGLGPL